MGVRIAQLCLALALVLSASIVVTNNQADAQNAAATVYYDSIYYPWVPNGDQINGTGPWHGSITVQNVEPLNDNRGVKIFVFDENILYDIAMDNSYSFEDGLEDANQYLLSPHSSMTLSAGDLGLEEPGSAVAVFGIYRAALENGEALPAPVLAGVQKQATPDALNQARTTGNHVSVDGYTAIPFVDVAWGSQSDTCHQLAGGVDLCDGAGYYTSPGGFGINGFDGHSYLPIAQTNDGWNTIIALSNIEVTTTTAASVDVTLITTDQQGYGASGGEKWSLNPSIAPGGTYVVDVADVTGDDNWVGSVHITSEVGIVSAAYRSKPGDNMLLTNTSAPSLLQLQHGFQPPNGNAELTQVGTSGYEQYAPLVFKEYNGWNTGFSFVNIAETTNTVTVTYYGPTGNVLGGDSRTISPLGQEFIFVPSKQDLGLGGDGGEGFVGAAMFTSSLPFHVAVDQVKYTTGEAMSYLATASGATAGDGEWPACAGCSELVMPLVQKGSQDGHGDISGLQIFNASSHAPVSAGVTFYNASGAAVSPTKDTPYPLSLGPLNTATLYTLTLSEMAQNQRSSAVIRPVGGEGQIVGVSNNVNYDVQGDGSAAYNMVNTAGQYRFPGLVGDFRLYSGGSDDQVRRTNAQTGEIVWSADLDSTIRSIDVADDGSIYASGASAATGVVKLDPDGNTQWSYFGHGSGIVWVVRASPNGDIISGGSSDEVIALDASGNELWRFDYGETVNTIAFDSASNIYVGGLSNGMLKLDPNGNQIPGFTVQPGTVRGIAVDQDDNVYFGGTTIDVQKLDSNGTLQWSVASSGTLRGMTVDASGFVYASFSGGTVSRLDPDTGAEIWIYNAAGGGNVYGLTVGSDGFIYAAISLLNSVHKFDQDGNLIDTFDPHPATLRAVATN